VKAIHLQSADGNYNLILRVGRWPILNHEGVRQPRRKVARIAVCVVRADCGPFQYEGGEKLWTVEFNDDDPAFVAIANGVIESNGDGLYALADRLPELNRKNPLVSESAERFAAAIATAGKFPPTVEERLKAAWGHGRGITWAKQWPEKMPELVKAAEELKRLGIPWDGRQSHPVVAAMRLIRGRRHAMAEVLRITRLSRLNAHVKECLAAYEKAVHEGRADPGLTPTDPPRPGAVPVPGGH
jgi:hypothetical protein